MSALALEAAALGKHYRLGPRQSYATLRDTVMHVVRRPFTRRPAGTREDRTFWALKDVSFQVRPGEILGLIGRNGAGKSTLLKLLARITSPSEGRGRVWGRVGSLLEVGTGFHPELTGRENIFLSGAILGMRRAEIIRKFDEIVAFAEVETFVDTPVKHYSSGMYLRLAFAVAAHLDPEILLVDEVLAVGDARFQRKCLDRMQTVGRHGRTVVFVSHNMAAITRLCERALLLHDGRLVDDGPAHQVASTYLQSGLSSAGSRSWPDATRAPGNSAVRLRRVRAVDTSDATVTTADIRNPVAIELEYDVLTDGLVLLPHFTVHNAEGVCAFVGIDQDPTWRGRRRPVGRYRSTGVIPGNTLAEGLMVIGAAMRSLEPDLLHFYERDAVSFQVVDTPGALTARGDYAGGIPGVVRPLLTWTSQTIGSDVDRAIDE